MFVVRDNHMCMRHNVDEFIIIILNIYFHLIHF